MYRKMIRTFASLCLTLCLVGVMPLRAAAWGRDGHQIVAGIAIWRLQQIKAKNALKNIDSILKSNLETPMLRRPNNIFSAAVWPDDVRGTDEYKFADDLHFVSIPLDRTNPPNALDEYDPNRVCRPSNKVPQVPEGVCIIGALQHYTNVLATSPSKKARLEALSFIIHFMGDLHQPLHTSEDKAFANHLGGKGDRGGNYRFLFYLADEAFASNDVESCVNTPNACTERFVKDNGEEERSNMKLHAAWDKYMIVTEMKKNSNRGPDFKAYGKDLVAHLPQNPSAAMYTDIEVGDFIQWARQTHQVAEQNAYGVIGPKPKISPADDEQYQFYLLNEAYRQKNIRVVDEQLIRAGIRLAAVLRRIFPDS
jgi:nuclease S1